MEENTSHSCLDHWYASAVTA